ncbi:bifunctional NAD(P)/FAD-dependent oxidoreductase/class I SAM-dependent methyltransferase [Mycolicibacterium sp. CBMA 295]|uniref:bifunctional NAD(P)/FAD-dependent oxidoreductase/class I SAM-dependent methyltransferase n=1 Tax=Mycolicibacterium sp. CBMA 295 TaxID=2606605 RepID=UPI0012DC5F07|nr:bifunctional NAD(P)/FAD-dependent oxidoreductase/class I SAM-dependent methyltransferase [Mycolicibacterium sp. CBMA 295]MUM29486.1 NAD(P)/FAD-dependent oxidoreductase [Mycolicibacterium sp. CBMA 295]
MDNVWDCIIVGGGAAGLSAALVLGRARRRVLLVDAGNQSNLAASGIGGLLGSDGRPPAELYAAGRAELAAYPTVEVRTGEVVRGEPGFVLELADGTRERARTVLLATGMEYRPPNIAGLEGLWGGSVFHCPFCHGWEMRDAAFAVIAQGDRAVHLALLMRGWTEDLVVLTDGDGGLDDAQVKQLDAAGIGVDDRTIAQFVAHDGELAAVEFADGTRLARRGALVAATLHQRSPLAAQLGAVSAPGPVAADAPVIDAFTRTSVPGLFAAGDLGAQMPQVAAAVASGSQAGAAVVQHLLGEDVGLPVPPWPAQTTVTAQYWERHYGQRGRVWSGRVNAQLAKIAADLAAGAALDLGCGEGGDAVWLAERGWQVTAVDVSETALGRAAAEAQERGVAEQITFERHDLSESFPDGRFDLVSAQFLHSPIAMDRASLLRRAAGAVAHGGLLVIVDHAAAPPGSPGQVRRFEFLSADEVLDSLNLDDAEWERIRERAATGSDTGSDTHHGTLVDNVMVLRRRA